MGFHIKEGKIWWCWFSSVSRRFLLSWWTLGRICLWATLSLESEISRLDDVLLLSGFMHHLLVPAELLCDELSLWNEIVFLYLFISFFAFAKITFSLEILFLLSLLHDSFVGPAEKYNKNETFYLCCAWQYSALSNLNSIEVGTSCRSRTISIYWLFEIFW